MKKLVALALSLVMLISAASTALAYSPEDPITIPFWHTRGSGANYEVLKASVDAFNETVGKEKGIIVEEIYQGNYNTNVTKIQLGSQSGDIPVIAVTSSAHTAMLLDDNLTADMAPYMAETGFDLNNLLNVFLNVPAIHDGEVHTLPYVRSTPVFYYNKTMADAKGLTAPKTIADMETFCKALHTVNAATGEVDTWGFLMLEDTSFIQGGLLWSTGSPLVAEGGTSPALENKSLLRLFSDWRRWVDEGWCKPYAPTNASAECTELFYRGKLAAFIASCGSLGNIKKFAAENGFELGVSYLPYYDEPATGSGGGNICLINGNSDEQLRAGWEFINFIMQDEWVALNAIKTGVETAVSTEELLSAIVGRAENVKHRVIKITEAMESDSVAVQQALADSLAMLNEKAPNDQVLRLKALEAMQKIADGKATKIIIPSELQGLAGMASGIVESVKESM